MISSSMGESENIAAMAEKVSEEIFGIFGWTTHPVHNENWDCVEPLHEKRTHPSDIVLSYDDPYSHKSVFFNVDLKSYGAGTIDKARVAGALNSLSMATECANASAAWKRRYADGASFVRVSGLLFVYNHDNEYDGLFDAILETCAPLGLDLPVTQRVCVLGPADVEHLSTVAADIQILRGRGVVPDASRCSFWYPDLVTVKPRYIECAPATFEMLRGPWITLVHPDEAAAGARKYVIWYREDRGGVDEFKYLIDHCFKYQMLNDGRASVEVRVVKSTENVLSNFRTATLQYDKDLYGLPGERLDRMTCKIVTRTVQKFSAVQIGWRDV